MAPTAPRRAPRVCALGGVALMRAVVIVVAHEVAERVLQRGAAREVPAAERDAPVLLQDSALQALDEAVGPGVARLRARVTNAEVPTGLIESPLELRAAVGEDAAQCQRRR